MTAAENHSGAVPRLLRSLVAHPRDGALPALLIVLTVVTGVVDAVSILGLGRVFVANMTGNVVFIGFALAGAPGFSLAASLAALAGFLVGAGAGGMLVARSGERDLLVRRCLPVELVLLSVATIVSAVAGSVLDAGPRDALAALLAVALGLQNAVARKLAVADLTTTVLTMTLTGLAADLRAGNVPVVVRRLIAVASMLVGALGGAVLVLQVSTATALGTATALVAATTVAAVASPAAIG